MKAKKRLIVASLAMALAACGGGGGGGTPLYGGGTDTPTTPGTENPATVANLVLQLDKRTVGNSGSEEVKVTVMATNADNQVVPDAAVSITADANAVVIVDSAKTDDQGKLSATVLVGEENRSNRTITVTAKVGTLVKTVKFEVIGAKLKATALPSVVEPSKAGQIIYQLTDVNGNPMVEQAIEVKGPNASLSASGKTDINGTYTFKYTAPAATGDLKFTATAGGVSQEDTVKVVAAGSDTIDAVPPGTIKSASVEASPSVVTINTATTSNQAAVRALFVGSDNQPIKNVRVRFEEVGADTYGSFTTGSTVVYSDQNGEATAAYVPGSRYSPTDGVTIRACYGYTDADLNGGACPYQVTTTLTVVSEAISVSIGTNNQLISNTHTYAQEFLVQVVDSAGKVMPGVTITPSLDLLRFAKGSWVLNGKEWVRVPTQDFRDFRTQVWDPVLLKLVPNQNLGKIWYLEDPLSAADRALDPLGAPLINSKAACWNEDRNRNGVIESEEDSRTVYNKDVGGNGNGKLDPSKSDVSVAILGDGKTDANGQVVLRIEYLQNLGSWLEYKLLVSGKVGGTEGRATWMDQLGVPVEAVQQEGEPPFVRSRYGVEAGCSNPR